MLLTNKTFPVLLILIFVHSFCFASEKSLQSFDEAKVYPPSQKTTALPVPAHRSAFRDAGVAEYNNSASADVADRQAINLSADNPRCFVLRSKTAGVNTDTTDLLARLHNYLKSQQSQKTGLVNSFSNTKDAMLLNQASTYDQALAGLAFLVLGDYDRAEKILRFFDKKWGGGGFANFYDTNTGNVGLEHTIHLGPNAWVAILALQYTAKTQSKKYLELAEDIAVWAIELNHRQGGLAMGPAKDWATDWRNVYSSENNIDAYCLFNLLSFFISYDKDIALLSSEKEGIIKFLRIVTFGRNPRIYVGIDNPIMATDVLALSLLAFKPNQLKYEMKISPEELFKIAQEQFLINIDGIKGYEFTDKQSVKNIGRPNMISLEWTAMMALAYIKIVDYYQQLYELTDDKKQKVISDRYQSEATKLMESLDKKILIMGNDSIAYPYATKGLLQVFPFAPWWKTPSDGRDGHLAAALASTCWRIFAEKKFNPLEIEVKTIK